MDILKEYEIQAVSDDELVNIALDTMRLGKQALIFVNSKASAEKSAEDIARKIKTEDNSCDELAESVLKVLSSPTKQCKRLSLVLKKGISFHHAGLHAKQREIVEDNFRKGKIRIICATPTLAMGIDMPAYRTIIRDLHRYGGPWGMSLIPVLEYHQMAGRAGRPGKEDYGEAIIIAKKKAEIKKFADQYIFGEPENIYSKLAVEPVLRTYILSLVAGDFVCTKKELFDFFEKTFYAHQYKDINKIHKILERMLRLLQEWEFIVMPEEDNMFSSADEYSNDSLKATFIGKRVAQLYIDPYTAHSLINGMKRALTKKINEFSFIQLISYTLELRPLLRTKASEYDDMMDILNKRSSELITFEPNEYEPDFENFVDSIKTALFFEEWIEEKDEEYLLEKYNIRPGEINAKLDTADWLLYSCQELARVMKFNSLLSPLIKLRIRLKYGVKEELLPLLRLKNIGKVRARKMFTNGIKNIGDVKSVDLNKLISLLGKAIAEDVKKQVSGEIKEAQDQLKLYDSELYDSDKK